MLAIILHFLKLIRKMKVRTTKPLVILESILFFIQKILERKFFIFLLFKQFVQQWMFSVILFLLFYKISLNISCAQVLKHALVNVKEFVSNSINVFNPVFIFSELFLIYFFLRLFIGYSYK